MREWTDHNGRVWQEPEIIGRLKFRIRCHAALRAFVMVRDRFACAHCGAMGEDFGAGYDGRHAVRLLGRRHGSLVVDHVVSRRNGGRHHPSNMQTLCEGCNARKACLVDAAVA